MSTADDKKLKHREYMRQWNAKNKDKVRSYHEKAKDKIAARRKARIESMTPEEREAHKERLRAATRRHKERNLEKINEKARLTMSETRARDPEKHRAYQKAYVAGNRERVAETRAQRRKKNPERVRSIESGMIFGPGQTIESMVEEQKGLCAICEKPLPDGKARHVDHCHTTGYVRAVLCHKCNLGIGHLNDDLPLVRKAADYLEAHQARISGILEK